MNYRLYRILPIVLLMFICNYSFAQINEVTLVVTGEGTNKEDAIQNALRSAVEQAFGVFVSANTEVLNDEIIRDEVATVSSGNIKSYSEMSYFENPSGLKMITLNATVSIGQLISFSKVHDLSTELAGASIAANMKLNELNARSTQKAIKNLYAQMTQIVPQMYNYSIKSATPSVTPGTSEVIFDLDIEIIANENTYSIGDYFSRSIQALSKTRDEIAPYLAMGYIGTAVYLKQYEGKDLKPRKISVLSDNLPLLGPKDKKKDAVFLYSYIPFDDFKDLFSKAAFNLEVIDNQSHCYEVFLLNRWNEDIKSWLMGRFTFENHQLNNGTLNSFCLLSPPMIGVYNVNSIAKSYSGGYRERDGIDQLLAVKTPDNCIANTIIVSCKYNPGDLIFSTKGLIAVPLEYVDTITEFSVRPVLQSEP